MLGACTRYSASSDLAAIRDELAKGGDVLVVDVSDLLLTERTRLLLKLLQSRSRHLRCDLLWF